MSVKWLPSQRAIGAYTRLSSDGVCRCSVGVIAGNERSGASSGPPDWNAVVGRWQLPHTVCPEPDKRWSANSAWPSAFLASVGGLSGQAGSSGTGGIAGRRRPVAGSTGRSSSVLPVSSTHAPRPSVRIRAENAAGCVIARAITG